MKNGSTLTQERLKEYLTYHPNSGNFFWRNSQGCCKAYSKAGVLDSAGYVRIKLERKSYAAHRLAFLYMEGSFPPEDVDHISGVRDDNRWMNLRKATRSQNAANSGVRPTNVLGVKNVTRLQDTQKYQVIIKQKSYGCYDDLETAIEVADASRKLVFGEYAKG